MIINYDDIVSCDVALMMSHLATNFPQQLKLKYILNGD